jgi:plastocyanin
MNRTPRFRSAIAGLLGFCVTGGLLSLGACDDDDPIYGLGGGSEAAADAELEIVLGDLQNGRTSEAYTEPLVVRAVQDLGLVNGVPGTQNIQPVENLQIDWTITKGLATLSNQVSLTNADGIASVTVTPGPLLGEVEVTATIAGEGGDFAEFSLRTTVFLIEILIDRFAVPLGGDSIEVVLGDTIEWVNRDALKHSVLSTSEPDTVFSFYSGDLDNSQRYRFVSKVEGVFEYVDPLSLQDEAPTGVISVVGRDVGALKVVTSTSGANPDLAYVVTINGVQSSAIGPADEVTFPALRATAQAVRLVEVQPNCTVAGDNPRSVTVIAQDTVTTTFQVTCD